MDQLWIKIYSKVYMHYWLYTYKHVETNSVYASSIYLFLTPNSQSVFRAWVSLNIHSFIPFMPVFFKSILFPAPPLFHKWWSRIAFPKVDGVVPWEQWKGATGWWGNITFITPTPIVQWLSNWPMGWWVMGWYLGSSSNWEQAFKRPMGRCQASTPFSLSLTGNKLTKPTNSLS